MASSRKTAMTQSVGMTDRAMGSPSTNKYNGYDTQHHPWYAVKHWGKKAWLIALGILVALIVVIVVAAVEATKKEKYPDYSKLNYSLTDTYSGETFFDDFDYFTGYDPTFGFVHYVPNTTATALNLTYASPTSAVLRVDTSVNASSVPNASTGRFSVRVTSKRTYGLNSLFLFDVLHTPMGCSTWPALWLVDPSNWPTNGEVDIMEATNVVASTNNQMTLHTAAGCTMNVKRKQRGTALSTSCVNSTNGNAGCGVHASTDASTFGTTFNARGGGVLAVELRAAGIRMWQFPRAAVPADVRAGASPDPSTWGEATADFPGTDCDVAAHFRNQSIVANIDLCGQWAGQPSVYGAQCPGECTDFVANNATAFGDAYWEFGQFRVYSAS